MDGKIKVHIVMNSHLDPICLWNLDQGIDEIIATARTACDLLDDYPELHLIRGESMFYETVDTISEVTGRLTDVIDHFDLYKEKCRGNNWFFGNLTFY